MSITDDLTVLVLTYNEAPNIGRTLDALAWARSILVVDSGSTDETLAIVGRCRQARVVTRKFDSFARQCNFGLKQIATEWVLSLDADYELTPELQREIAALEPARSTAGYRTGFVYCVHGRPLKGTLYPPRTTLYRRAKAQYRDEGHGHRVVIEGDVLPLAGKIRHDDRKPLARWLDSQKRYAAQEADHLIAVARSELGSTDRLRLMGWPAPIAAFLYTLLVKRCILDGWPGWHYVLQRTFAETLIALEIADRKLKGRP